MITQIKNTGLDWLKAHPVKWLPDLLTLARIYFTVPVCIGMLLFSEGMFRWGLLALYAAIALFDFFDGFLARLWGVTSQWGARWDPRADKILVGAVLATATLDLGLEGSYWYAITTAFFLGITVTRDWAVDNWRNHVNLPSSDLAKWKTTTQMFGLGFLIVGPTADWVVYSTLLVGIAILTVATTLVFYTGNQYYQAYRRKFA